MVRTRKIDLNKEVFWREQMALQATSGSSIAAWCRQNQVAVAIFHYWRHTIARRDMSLTAPLPEPAILTPAAFVPVIVEPESVFPAELRVAGTIRSDIARKPGGILMELIPIALQLSEASGRACYALGSCRNKEVRAGIGAARRQPPRKIGLSNLSRRYLRKGFSIKPSTPPWKHSKAGKSG